MAGLVRSTRGITPQSAYRNNFKFARDTGDTVGIPTSLAGGSRIRSIPTGHVALIDRIKVQTECATAGALATAGVSVAFADGIDGTIRFGMLQHTVSRQTMTVEWRPNGKMVLPAGTLVDWVATSNLTEPNIEMDYRLVLERDLLQDAAQGGWHNGTASWITATLATGAGNGLGSAHKTLIPAATGKSVEIGALYVSGAILDTTNTFNLLFEFDNGSTQHKVFRFYYDDPAGENHLQPVNIVLDEVGIRGPAGFGLRCVGSPDNANTRDVINVTVVYRYVKDHETVDPTGGTADGPGKYWWRYTEATTDNTHVPWLPATKTGNNVGILRGYTHSLAATAAGVARVCMASPDILAVQAPGLWAGADYAAFRSGTGLFVPGSPDSGGDDEQPGIYVSDTGGDIAAHASTAWGEVHPISAIGGDSASTGQGYIARFFN